VVQAPAAAPDVPLATAALDTPDDRREFDGGRLDVVRLAGRALGRFTLEPGWRWSESVAPLVGTELCQASHFGYVVSGRMAVRMADGTEGVAGPGEAYRIAPGHDAWVVGDEPAFVLDVEGASGYAVGS
jgi:hypothetical protein